jgi:hypothetical protein
MRLHCVETPRLMLDGKLSLRRNAITTQQHYRRAKEVTNAMRKCAAIARHDIPLRPRHLKIVTCKVQPGSANWLFRTHAVFVSSHWCCSWRLPHQVQRLPVPGTGAFRSRLKDAPKPDFNGCGPSSTIFGLLERVKGLATLQQQCSDDIVQSNLSNR